MAGYALDSRPQTHTNVVEALISEMKSDDPIFTWKKSTANELYTAIPGFIVLLTPTAVMGDSKLLLRAAGVTSHTEVPLGSDEDRELRELILASDPQTMDGDEWVCSMFCQQVGALALKRRG